MRMESSICGMFGVLVSIQLLLTCHNAEAQSCDTGQVKCSDGSRCVPRHWICDGEDDCRDGSDEGNCARCLPYRWMCGDNNLCVSHDWRCDGKFDCNDGSDERKCGDTIVLITGYNEGIYKINTTDNTQGFVFREGDAFENLAYDPVLQHIYWSNLQTYGIQRINLDGGNVTNIAHSTKCQGMVVDHIARLFFYSNHNARNISKLDLQTNQTTVIVSYTVYKIPHDLTADMKSRKLYWTVFGQASGIEASDYNGENRMTLLTAGDLPTTLALDSTGTILFWCDERQAPNELMALHLDTGRTRSVHYGTQGRLFDMAGLNAKLYLIDRNQRSAYLTVDETGGEAVVNPVSELMSEYRHIKVFSHPYEEEECQQYSNETVCSEDILCIPSSWRCDGIMNCSDGTDEMHCD